VRGVTALVDLLFKRPRRLACAICNWRRHFVLSCFTSLPENSLHVLTWFRTFALRATIDVTPIPFCLGVVGVTSFIHLSFKDPADFALAVLVRGDGHI